MKARERYARKVEARVEAIIRNPTCKRKCQRCRGYGTLYQTDGRPVLCPACLGSGEENASNTHPSLVRPEHPHRACVLGVLHHQRAV